MRTRLRLYFTLILGIASLLPAMIPQITVAQQKPGTLSGMITDSTGAVIPNAKITLKSSTGAEQTLASDGLGRYTVSQLPPGQYLMQVNAEGFSIRAGIVINIVAGRAITLNVQLQIAMVEQRVEVLADSIVDVEPTSNASALTLSGSSLQTLSDDPDELAQDLQMLAGPSAGPGGGELFVDGFSGAKLPPKSAIREVRVNQNPFSAEYDRLGYGRVEILTKPGSGNLHGDARFIFNDDIFNSRNPFAPDKPDYQRRIYEGTLTGPIKEHTSFTAQFERRNIGQAALINALILNDSFDVVNYRDTILNPRTNTELSGRIDHQLGTNHTLVGRYEWEKNYLVNAGLNTYSMPTRAYDVDEREQVLQLTETAVLSPTLVNEVKFQYRRSHDTYDATNAEPAVQVPDAFTLGGTSAGLNSLVENRYELQEMMSWSAGKNMLKAGGRFRAIDESSAEADNYNGMFTFNTLDSYRITEMGIQAGLTPDEIRAKGGGASQFTMSAGDPLASVTQYDVGLFFQDDWRVRDNLTLSAGLRFEKQTNINDWSSWGPRLGFAWGIPGGGPNRPFAVLRAGFGAFYERIRESLVLDTRRLDGVNQQSYFIPNPDFYPTIPDPATLSSYAQDQAIRRFSPNLHAPNTQQFVLSLEKQFPANTTASASYMHSNGIDMLRSRNVNAPLEETGVRPIPGPNVYAYESNGRFRQDQLIANVNARISPRLNLFGYYTWSKAHSDTDGAQTFPSYTYDLAAEYARAGFDVEQRAMIGGSLTSPFLGILFNPFVVMHSGEPFNIVVGPDLNGDSIFNDRPAFASDPSLASVVHTKWGDFDTQPSPGQTIIPRNLGGSPGMWVTNLRVSKAFGFGEHSGGAPVSSQGGSPIGSGPGGPGGGPGGGHYHGSDTTAVGHRYSLTVSASARNLLNHINLNAPVGNLSSPLFGTSTSTHGFGPGSASANRTIDFGVFLSF